MPAPENVPKPEALLQAVGPWVVVLDEGLRLLYVNRSSSRGPPEAVVGLELREILPTADFEALRHACQQTRRLGRPCRLDIVARQASGEFQVYDVTVSAMPDSSDEPRFAVVASIVTDERAMTRELLQESHRLQLSLVATQIALFQYDLETGLGDWDTRMHALFGTEEPLSLSALFRETIEPTRGSKVPAWATGLPDEEGERPRGTERLYLFGSFSRAGVRRWVLVEGRLIPESTGTPRLAGGVVDVTRHFELREQFEQSNRLESVRELTAGVAHNFNNLLMSLEPMIEQMARHAPETEECRVAHADARKVLDRASGLIDKLMVFRHDESNTRSWQTMSAFELADRLVTSMPKSMRERVHVEEPPDELDGLRILCDAKQITDAIRSLLDNALEATSPEVAGPTLRFRRDQEVSRPDRDHPEDEDWVVIEVEDHGPGVPTSLRHRVFDPFFTSRGPQRHGLGLSVASASAVSHGGWLDLAESVPFERTVFQLGLPVLRRPPPRARPSASAEPIDASTPVPARPPRALLIDDEPLLLRSLVRYCQAGGVDVIGVESAEEALERLTDPGCFGALLVDLSLPAASIPTIIATARRNQPGIRVAVFSGSTVPAALRESVEAVLSKPMRAERFRDTVRQLLQD